MNDDDLVQVRQQGPLPAQVKHLAGLAQANGLDGVVCSPREIALVRAACGPDFLIVTPGVRPAGAAIGDQRRVMTPAEAVAAGADILVIGRPITAAANPGDAAKAIAAEIVAPAGA
jgi:orotidine-5'-phosphate decarboxylase